MNIARYRDITVSEFWCTRCGRQGIPIARRAGKQREAGHLKRLWCKYCQLETNHAEVRPFGAYNREDFQEEFRLGRFVNGKKYAVADLLSCTKTDCGYNKNGKCWNSNHSYNCGHRIVLENGAEDANSGLERDR